MGIGLHSDETAIQSGVYLADLQDNGRRITTPRAFTLDEALDQPAAWTANSKALVFTSTKTAAGKFTNSRGTTMPRNWSQRRWTKGPNKLPRWDSVRG
jgi:hypothetical protein